jgi:hypothetical protein
VFVQTGEVGAEDGQLPFDIGESRAARPVATFEAWPVEDQTGAAVDDPTGGSKRRDRTS